MKGYIFGTDSWADPSVLFGPYEFATSSDRLPPYCRGGEGRDDGKVQSNMDGVGQHANAKVVVNAEGEITEDKEEGENVDADSSKCKYFEQCHRNFPNSKSCNIHKYKDGLIYRAHAAGATIYPSIGGWTLSGSFPVVAATKVKREKFAEECVGLIADYGFDGKFVEFRSNNHTWA